MRYYSLWFYSTQIHSFIFCMEGTNENLKALGNQIRNLRRDKNLSQEAVALQAAIDRSYLGSIERGERNVGFLTLVKIAEVLECSVSDFTKYIPQ